MELTLATRPTPGRDNEDALVAGSGYAVVIDGATAEPGVSGCVHGVRWYATRLAGRLAAGLAADPEGLRPLTEVLHEAIEALRGLHEGRCDLANPRSPSATVAIARRRDGLLDHLVLGDATVAFQDRQGRAEAVTDDRIMAFDHLPWEDLHQARNVPGGFWVAAAAPEAAERARTGSVPVAGLRRAALLSDGAARLAERYGTPWADLLDLLGTRGPLALIEATREAERATAPGRFSGKHHDDATAVLCAFPEPAR